MTPQQNGVAKRMSKSIAERAWCLLLNIELEKFFWADAVSMACLDGKVVEEVWTRNEVDYSGLRIFGCPAYVHIPSKERSKVDPKSR
jgi:hypothetical protein